MATTLATLVQTLLERTESGRLGTTTSAATALDEILDTALQDAGEAAEDNKNDYLRVTSGAQDGQERRIASYEPSNGTLVVGRDYAAAIASGVTYLQSKTLGFTSLKACVNWALARMFYEDLDIITPVAGQTQYTPTFATRRGQIKDVLIRTGTTADAYTWRSAWFDLVEDGGTTPGSSAQVLRVNLGSQPDPTEERIVLKCVRAYGELTTYAATTDADVEWCLAGARAEFYRRAIESAGGQAKGSLKDAHAEARLEWGALCIHHQPHVPQRLPAFGVRRFGVPMGGLG